MRTLLIVRFFINAQWFLCFFFIFILPLPTHSPPPPPILWVVSVERKGNYFKKMIFVEECWDLQQQEKEDGVSRVKRIKIKKHEINFDENPRRSRSLSLLHWISLLNSGLFFFSQCIRPEKCLLAFQVGRFRRHGRPNCFVCFVLFFCCFLLYLGSPKIRFLLKWRMARDRLLFATERLPRLGGADQRKTTANICLRRFRVATFGLGLKKKQKTKNKSR